MDIRAIKQTLKMEHLVCKTPAMVRRELWAHLLGYNLVRKVLAQAAVVSGLSPRQLSFAGGLQTLEEFRWLLAKLPTEELRAVALAKMEGYTNEGISARQNCAVSTVERRLGLIRTIWQEYSNE